ncbi:glycosyl transferase family protein [Litorivivens sp.]|uniref:glycosyl transferase family protein n=1 Tax=Litorivivens sp. TaxID=2020868 RepID=UPI003563CEA3
MSEHAFAPYVRILGKGKTGSRSLDFEEAQEAFGMILRGEVEPVQLGAFLMLLRVKEESPEELAGFVSAVRAHIQRPSFQVDLDWASYAGKRRQHPWYLLAALTLAMAGYRVLMHGAAGHTAGRLYSEQALGALGHAPCENWADAEAALAQSNFAFVPLRSFCEPLQRIIDLRNLFGLRSPVNTLTRLINPVGARCSMQSIFHPAYADSHQRAAQLLGQENAVVFKGEAGEAERRPEADLKLHLLLNNNPTVEEWPRLLSGRQDKLDTLPLDHLKACWQGTATDTYGEQAVIGTLAIALRALGKTTKPDEAHRQANDLWQSRLGQRI